MDLTGVTLDTANVAAGGLVVVTALVAIWAIKATIAIFRQR